MLYHSNTYTFYALTMFYRNEISKFEELLSAFFKELFGEKMKRKKKR
jgi:hypothetical protein